MSASAAVEPEPEQPVERTYEVTGVNPVFGTKPGESFKRLIPLEQEARLIAGGAIKRTTKEPAKSGGKKGRQPAASPDKKE